MSSCQRRRSCWLVYVVMLTRFTGANGVFATTILDIAKRKPHLIFKEPAAPYEI